MKKWRVFNEVFTQRTSTLTDNSVLDGVVFESVDNIKKEYWERLSDEEKKKIRISEEIEKDNEFLGGFYEKFYI